MTATTIAAKQAEEVRVAALAEEERHKKEAEEKRLKEPVKAKLIRLLADVRAKSGSEKKAALDELETTVLGLKTEELVGESDAEKAAKKERDEHEKAEKERKAAELKEAHAASR